MPTQKKGPGPRNAVHTRAQQGKPAAPKKRPGRRGLSLIAIAGIALAAGILLAGAGFTFAATQEQHDSFCASCHSQPETAYYQRSTAAQPADLASFHTTKGTACINCHSGPGVTGRMSAELMGARNATLWFTGTATQPAPLTIAIHDGNCLKCHEQVTNSRSRNNHFHFFLAEWQNLDPKAAGCVTCHHSHTTDSSAPDQFMTEAEVQPVCDACHNAVGEGD